MSTHNIQFLIAILLSDISVMAFLSRIRLYVHKHERKEVFFWLYYKVRLFAVVTEVLIRITV